MVSLPASVQSVGDGAFRGCHNLATVIFNNSSIAIGTDAFKTPGLYRYTQNGLYTQHSDSYERCR